MPLPPIQRAAVWCKAVTDAAYIPSELRTELSRLRRVRPLTRFRVPDFIRNKSGTAEVSNTFVSCYERQRCFYYSYEF